MQRAESASPGLRPGNESMERVDNKKKTTTRVPDNEPHRGMNREFKIVLCDSRHSRRVFRPPRGSRGRRPPPHNIPRGPKKNPHPPAPPPAHKKQTPPKTNDYHPGAYAVERHPPFRLP